MNFNKCQIISFYVGKFRVPQIRLPIQTEHEWSTYLVVDGARNVFFEVIFLDVCMFKCQDIAEANCLVISSKKQTNI